MKWFGIAIIYLGFFCLIGVSVYYTGSAIPLLALLLTPNYVSDEESNLRLKEGVALPGPDGKKSPVP